MAGLLVPCVHSLVDDLEFILRQGKGFHNSNMEYALFKVRNIKIFLLSSKKLGNNNPKLKSFLQTLEDKFCLFSNFYHTARLYHYGEATIKQLKLASCPDREREIETQLGDWGERMYQFYITLLDTSRQFIISLATDEVEEIFDSVLKNLLVLHTFDWGVYGDILKKPMKALEEQMKFLRNLSHFASEAAHSKAKEDVFAHIEAISINVAYVIFKCDAEAYDEKIFREMLPKISELIQNIKPTDPQIYKAYIEVLSSSKFERRLLDPADRDLVKEDYHAKEFLNSLMSEIWDMLQLDTHDISTKDQLLELYEGFGSLAIILSLERDSIDLKTKDLIFDVVCDSGILLCSFYQTDIKVDDDGLHDLLKSIRLILAEDGDKGTPDAHIRSTAPLSFLDFLLERLMELITCEVETNTRKHAQIVKEELIFLRSFLKDVDVLRLEQQELQAIWDHILELVYRTEYLIDYLVVGDLSDDFSTSFGSIMKDIENIKLKIELHKPEIKMMKAVTMTRCQMPSQKSPLSVNAFVGFHEEANTIKNRLTRGSKNLQSVAIVGMPGQGKTTLAAKVYNDPSVSHHFSVCAWTTVSQKVEKRRILLDLLSQIDPNQSCAIISNQDLVEKVWRSLKGRRFLIFLDDIWEAQVLIDLKDAFPEDHMASRIMLTSRRHDIPPEEEPHKLRPFNAEESMELLQTKLFGGGCWPTELYELGRQIIQICKGLPLTILIVVGVLTNTEPRVWETILGGLRSGIVSSVEQCRNTLELSYMYLPEHLRPCFLYFAAFAEDEVNSCPEVVVPMDS